jgi:steroid 5-alpha reductase family enzyme
MSGIPFLTLVSALLFSLSLMCATWLLGRRVRNYGIVDAVWAFAFAGVAMIYAVQEPGWLLRRVAVSLLVALWSLRLGVHLLRRVITHHPEEDRRYAELRVRWGEKADRGMFGFFLMQGLSVVLLSLPFLLAAGDPLPGFRDREWIAVVLGLLAVFGEGVADHQLRRSKAAGELICRRGLWAWSRHPNYFFEWLVWVAFAGFASAAPYGWLAWAAPILMLHFLVNVTGIPLTEELSVRRKGESYREYQRTTSAFVPWFGKET